MNKKNNLLLLCLTALTLIFTILAAKFTKENYLGLKQNAKKDIYTVNNSLKLEEEYSFLIGLRQDIDKDTTTYRVLFLKTDEKNNLRLFKELPFLIIPSEKKLLTVEPVMCTYEETSDYIETLAVHGFNEGYSSNILQYKKDSFTSKISYINRKYLSVENYSFNKKSSQIENEALVLKIEDIPKLRNSNAKVSINEIFPDIKEVIKEYKNESKEGIKNTTDGSNWAVIRENGCWVPKLAQSFNYYNSYKDYKLKEIPYSLDESFGVENNKSFLAEIRNLFPEAKDAFINENSKVVGVLLNNNINFYPKDNAQIGKTLLSLQLKDNEKVIMFLNLNKEEVELINRNLK